jgi:F-type H+-transporting ATPase subunit delta
MGPTIIARNYAETLLTLAERHGGEQAVDAYGEAMEQVAELLHSEPRIRAFLASPSVGAEAKQRALRASFTDRVPELFLRFLLVVVEKRRQSLLGSIAHEYTALVDARRGRLRAEIRLPHEADETLRGEIVATLEKRYGRTILPDFRVEPELVAGVVIRVGDQILDGSFRRRVSTLRRRLHETRFPRPAAG